MKTEHKSNNSFLDLHCKGVNYDGKTVLAPFHLQLFENQHVAIIGTSGAGKTTLLKVIFDYLNNTPQKTALIPQKLGLVDNLSVFHNVYMGQLDQCSTVTNLINLITPRKREKNIIQSILATLSLNDKSFTLCGELSGGQQQRVAIARAIYRQAKILIADEPVANLDHNQAEIALQEMMNNHINCILALHNTQQALNYCDRIIGITNGKITLDAMTTQICAQDLTNIYMTPDHQHPS
ncbi:MAG: ATP-binding cassette domain-containing protein [Betaproteobacteria bacterium]|nr:ATP-binding cassette domain-containing protein [Betaproteobacteria bacterium]